MNSMHESPFFVMLQTLLTRRALKGNLATQKHSKGTLRSLQGHLSYPAFEGHSRHLRHSGIQGTRRVLGNSSTRALEILEALYLPDSTKSRHIQIDHTFYCSL